SIDGADAVDQCGNRPVRARAVACPQRSHFAHLLARSAARAAARHASRLAMARPGFRLACRLARRADVGRQSRGADACVDCGTLRSWMKTSADWAPGAA